MSNSEGNQPNRPQRWPVVVVVVVGKKYVGGGDGCGEDVLRNTTTTQTEVVVVEWGQLARFFSMSRWKVKCPENACFPSL